MAKRHIYKKSKNGEPIEVTARQLTELYEEHEGILASRQYKDLKEWFLSILASATRNGRLESMTTKLCLELGIKKYATATIFRK